MQTFKLCREFSNIDLQILYHCVLTTRWIYNRDNYHHHHHNVNLVFVSIFFSSIVGNLQ